MDSDDEFLSSDSSDGMLDSSDSDDETLAYEQVFTQPVKAESNIITASICQMLQLEKDSLNVMRTKFKKELKILLTQA